MNWVFLLNMLRANILNDLGFNVVGIFRARHPWESWNGCSINAEGTFIWAIFSTFIIIITIVVIVANGDVVKLEYSKQ